MDLDHDCDVDADDQATGSSVACERSERIRFMQAAQISTPMATSICTTSRSMQRAAGGTIVPAVDTCRWKTSVANALRGSIPANVTAC
jgi:hypothetical protein